MNDYWYLDPDNYYILLLAKQNIHLFILTEIILYLQFLVLRSLLKEIFINWKGYLSFCDLIMLHSWVWLLTILLENTCINQLINWFHANTISNLVWVTSTLISIFFFFFFFIYCYVEDDVKEAIDKLLYVLLYRKIYCF